MQALGSLASSKRLDRSEHLVTGALEPLAFSTMHARVHECPVDIPIPKDDVLISDRRLSEDPRSFHRCRHLDGVELLADTHVHRPLGVTDLDEP